MKKNRVEYMLDPEFASCGRRLWNNLVTDDRSSSLDRFQGFGRVTPEGQEKDTCTFVYKGVEIMVTRDNRLIIEAEAYHSLNNAETLLRKICAEKGVPLALAG